MATTTRTRRTQAERTATTRGALLRAARELFAERGFAATGRDDIAERAGVTRGALYHHFESKEAILVELLGCYHSELDRIGADGLAAADPTDARPVAAKIIALGSAIAGCAVSHQAALQMLAYEAPGASPQLIELLQRRPTAVQDAMIAGVAPKSCGSRPR